MEYVGADITRHGDARSAFATENSAFAAVEVDLGTPAKRSGSFTIAGTGMTPGKPVKIWLAVGPYTGKGFTSADEVQLYEIEATGVVTSSTVITIYWRSRHRVRGNVKFNYLIGA